MTIYRLLDSGSGEKLEEFGAVRLIRPATGAVWEPLRSDLWAGAHARFSRERGMRWEKRGEIPSEWTVEHGGLAFLIRTTDFGHVGLFPEHEQQWGWIQEQVQRGSRRVLNLFAYSGGATLAAAQAGGEVCHLDASQGMVEWARCNAALNNLADAPIRWIVDDALKFLKREVKRGRQYDGIILDPPSFGRGRRGEVFKLENQLLPLLSLSKRLLSNRGAFLLLSCHTPGYTPTTLRQLLSQVGGAGDTEAGELLLPAPSGGFALPSGSYARWSSV